MSRRDRNPKVHLDATRAGRNRQALCGWLCVETADDVTQVTCKSCLARFRSGGSAQSRGELRGDAGRMEVGTALVTAFVATLEPKAGAPPRVTPPVWAASCRGGEHRRCGSCELCAWEREADRWHAVSPWNPEPATVRHDRPTTWPNLAAAFVALADWESHDRWSPSAMGGILKRIESGEIGGTKDAKGDDPLLRRAGDLVLVRKALEAAFPEGAHAVLSQAQCMRLLMSRTPGVLAVMPTYEALAEDHVVTVGDLKALVREGRRRVTVELAARGMIPVPHPKRGMSEDIHAAREKMQAVAHG